MHPHRASVENKEGIVKLTSPINGKDASLNQKEDE
jgi:hypothetical protein